ncbi:MAG: hypothetical protein IJX92_07405 [Clostridia bacterium]|nr:hypothetical protein [Clostridia bacterium]
MKKKINTKFKILALLLALIMMLSLAACQMPEGEGDTADAGKMTLVLAGDETVVHEVDLAELDVTNGLVSVLDYLKSEGKLDYAITAGYLDSVGELENNADTGEYIYIYTSVAEDADVTQWAKTVEYDGKTLTSSGVGAADMHIEADAVIYIGLIVWGN